MAKKNKSEDNNLIVQNRRSRFDFFISDKLEAGIMLEGWEVKAIRSIKGSGGSVNIAESYVFIKNGEAFISGLNIEPLITTSTHVKAEPTRIRKLLLNKKEIIKLDTQVSRNGMTLVATNMYWSDTGKVKLTVGLAQGKNSQDKRQTEKDRDWNRTKSRMLKAM